MKTFNYVVLVLVLMASLMLPFFEAFAPKAYAAGVETAFQYDSSPDAVKKLSDAADSHKMDGISGTKVAVRGGFFGAGKTFGALRYVDNYGYQYGFNYYCLDGNGVAQMDHPDNAVEYYKIEVSINMDLRKDFYSKDNYDHQPNGQGKAKNSYQTMLTHVTRHYATPKDNSPTKSDKDAGDSKGMGQFAADDPNDTTVAGDGNKDKIDIPTSCLNPLKDLDGMGSMVNLQSDKTPQNVKDGWKAVLSAAGADDGNASAGGGSGSGKDSVDCDATGVVLSWIICPVIDLGTNFSDYAFEHIISPLLTDVPISADPGSGTYQAWTTFRVIANVFLVGSLLVIVYSQARGGK